MTKNRLTYTFKLQADYSHVDPSNINEWLGLIGTDFKQYTYNLVQAGVDRDFLISITDEHLSRDCQITNGVHRTKILEAVKHDQSHPNRHDEPVAESKCFVNRITFSKITKNY